MAKFPGMVIGRKFCATAREAADRAGVSTQAIYARAQRGWVCGRTANSGGRKAEITGIRYRDKPFPDVATAAKSENVSRQAVYDHLRISGQIQEKP